MKKNAKSKNIKKWYLVMILLVFLFFGTVIGFNIFKQKMIASYLANMPEPVSSVTSLELITQTWTPTIDSFGFIEPVQGVTLASEASGKVVDISFDSGQIVKKGDVLTKLNTELETANLRAAKARLPAVRRQQRRIASLYKTGSASEGQKDEALAEYQTLLSEIVSLEAAIDRRTIVAPFDGIVGLRNVFLGQFLQAGDNIVRLEDQSTMRMRFSISQKEYAKIHIGQDLDVIVDSYPDQVFKGKISAIESMVSYQSGIIEVQAQIPNENNILRSGMYARIKIILPTLENQIVIPQSAVNFTLYGDSVYVIKESQGKDGKVETRVVATSVKLGARKDDQVIAIEGLKQGDEIVSAGLMRLSNGSLVKVTKSNTLDMPKQLPSL